jgi:hypothetical protein
VEGARKHHAQIVMEGSRPTNVLLAEKLTPRLLGTLDVPRPAPRLGIRVTSPAPPDTDGRSAVTWAVRNRSAHVCILADRGYEAR